MSHILPAMNKPRVHEKSVRCIFPANCNFWTWNFTISHFLHMRYFPYLLIFMTIISLCGNVLKVKAFDTDQTPDIRSLQETLSEIMPSYIIPARPLLFSDTAPLVEATLLGFDVISDSRKISSVPVSYHESSNLKFVLYWLPKATLPSNLLLKISLSGSGPVVTHEYPVEIKDWQTGVVCKQEVDFAHPGKKYSGQGTLIISTFSPDAGDRTEDVQYAGPVNVLTQVYPSKIADERLKDCFGKTCLPLSASFRLGQGASVTVTVPENLQKKCRGLGIISATSYDAKPFMGEQVCSIGVSSEERDKTYYLEHGISTAKADHDFYNTGILSSKKIEVFSSKKANRKNMENKPFDIYEYAGRISFDKNQTPESIKFKYSKEKGTINVNAIVLFVSNE